MKHIGFIGSGWLVQAMTRAWQNRYQITLTTRDPEKQQQLAAQGVNCLTYNMGDDAPWLADLDGLIIATTCKDLKAHQSLLDELKHKPDLPVLFTSSTSVYPNDGRSHTEDSPWIKTDHPLYAIEQCLQQHPKTTVIRCGGLIGPDRHPGRFFQTKAIPSPDAPVNLLPLEDALGIFRYVLEQDLSGLTLNACDDEHPTKGEYYPKMAQAIGLPAPDCQESSTDQGKIVETQRLMNELGYQLQGTIWRIKE